MNGAVNHPKTKYKNGQHQIIERQIVFQIDQAKQSTSGNALQAVFAAGEGRLQEKEIQHLRECQGDHGEVDALSADGQTAHQPRHECRKQGAAEDPPLGRPA